MTNQLISDLKAQIAEGRVVVVVGAGISAAATGGAPVATWSGLLRDGVERCEVVVPNLPKGWGDRLRQEIESGDIDDLLSAAEKVATKLGNHGGEYTRWLRESVGRLKVNDDRVIRAIARLNVPVITTNYDSLIEKVTGWHAVTWKESGEFQYLIRGEGDERGVLHLHGYWRDAESVILGVRSYSLILADKHTQAILQALQAMRTLLFIGFGAGLADPNFTALLRWARATFSTSEFRHYRLARASELPEISAKNDPADRIYVLPYGDSYGDLADFLEQLNPLAERPAMPPVATEAPAKGSTAFTDSSQKHTIEELLARAVQAIEAVHTATNTLVHVQRELTHGISALTGLRTNIPVHALREGASQSPVDAGTGAVLMGEAGQQKLVAFEQAKEAARKPFAGLGAAAGGGKR